MEPLPAPARPAGLTRLCVMSFIDQGLFLLLYILGIPAAIVLKNTDADQVNAMVERFYSGLLEPEQIQAATRTVEMMRDHGVALMSVLALRTLVRFIGTLRMWRLHWKGFHIYTTAQLLGLLVPMLIAGSELFTPLSLIIVLGWCYLYWNHRRAMVY